MGRAENHLVTGKAAEWLAYRYLRKQGLTLLSRNYRCIHGEIDLVMQDRADIVFVEVRYRRNSAFGGSLSSVDSRKQSKLWKTALNYCQKNHLDSHFTCRFDVIGLSSLSFNDIEWVKNAFSG